MLDPMRQIEVQPFGQPVVCDREHDLVHLLVSERLLDHVHRIVSGSNTDP